MYISVDMGGTYTRIASSLDLASIKESIKFNTKKELIDQKNTISYYIKKFVQNEKITGICMGVPGTLNYKENKFLKFPNYKALQGESFGSLLSEDLQKNKLFIVNDAHMAGYMEALKGSGEKYNNVLYISIGTGIGGVLIKNKNIEDIFANFEPGHECIYNDGLDFEDHCSGRAFTRIYGITADQNVPNNIWKEYAKELTKGLTFLKSKYSADVIVLGGGFSVKNFSNFNGYVPENINIKSAKYGDNSGLLGGFEILSKKL